jgi:hypothetical protein
MDDKNLHAVCPMGVPRQKSCALIFSQNDPTPALGARRSCCDQIVWFLSRENMETLTRRLSPSAHAKLQLWDSAWIDMTKSNRSNPNHSGSHRCNKLTGTYWPMCPLLKSFSSRVTQNVYTLEFSFYHCHYYLAV